MYVYIYICIYVFRGTNNCRPRMSLMSVRSNTRFVATPSPARSGTHSTFTLSPQPQTNSRKLCSFQNLPTNITAQMLEYH